MWKICNHTANSSYKQAGHDFVSPTANFEFSLLRILNDLMNFRLFISKLSQMKN